MFGAAVHVHLAEGHANGAGGAEDDAVAFMAEIDGGLDDGGEGREERFVRCFVDYGGGALEKISIAVRPDGQGITDQVL
jgi:hypothetical protein